MAYKHASTPISLSLSHTQTQVNKGEINPVQKAK